MGILTSILVGLFLAVLIVDRKVLGRIARKIRWHRRRLITVPFSSRMMISSNALWYRAEWR